MNHSPNNSSSKPGASGKDKQKKLAMLVGLVVAAAAIFGAVTVFPSASNQGYAPEQPIPFSHKLHVGTNKIDCQYCHVHPERSRHSTVPGVGICMNCHSVVKTDSPWIQKIQQAYKENKPIEWVRVHELPDYVYFPHKRHLAAGLVCENCHGDVKNMDKLYQYSALTMGWCMECHRGQTTPKNVAASFAHLPMDEAGRHPVAPVNCNTCHY